MKIIKSKLLKIAQDRHMTKVTVSVTGSGPGWFVNDHDPEVYVYFTIDMDVREWGINELNLVPYGTVDVNYTVVHETGDPMQEGTEEHKSVQVDLTQIKPELAEGRVFTLNDLSICINPDGTIDYGRSNITSYFIGDPI